jgi:hypothetical protein
VIKSSIVEAIRGANSESTTAVEYLKNMESQFVGSSKAYSSTLIKRLITEKYTSGGIREHILKNIGCKLFKGLSLWTWSSRLSS